MNPSLKQVYLIFCLIEPLKIKVGKEYNLNNVKEIKVTDEFLTLDKTTMNCQNKESLQDCETREYIQALIEQCKCLPFPIRNADKVFVLNFSPTSKIVISMILLIYIILGRLCYQ